MMFRAKTSLGIDISEDRISVVLLRQVGGEIELVKAADAPVPEGTMTNGNITNPASLAGAIKELFARNQIRRQPATVSLVAKPVLTQIIDLPDDIPENLGQFIRSEIRHCPALAGREPHYDFCGLNSVSVKGASRVFVGATDSEKISALLKTFSLVGTEPRAIELGITASVRALYTRRMSDKYNCNLLFGFIQGSVVTICVFRKGEFDFIRLIDMDAQRDDSDKYIARYEEEISAVIQYYDIEVENGVNVNWEFVVALDNTAIDAQDLEFALLKRFSSDVHICSPSTIYIDTQLMENTSVEKASINAIGLAMRHFDVPVPGAEINLIPPEVAARRAVKRLILITANVAAVILLFMLITVGVVRVKLARTEGAVPQAQGANSVESMEQLLRQQNLIDARVAELSEKKAEINQIFEDENVRSWGGILDDIRRRTPTTVCIT